MGQRREPLRCQAAVDFEMFRDGNHDRHQPEIPEEGTTFRGDPPCRSRDFVALAMDSQPEKQQIESAEGARV
jgi:hypothetical protein